MEISVFNLMMIVLLYFGAYHVSIALLIRGTNKRLNKIIDSFKVLQEKFTTLSESMGEGKD